MKFALLSVFRLLAALPAYAGPNILANGSFQSNSGTGLTALYLH